MFLRGFTLTELLIVIAILGILSAIAIPIYQDQITKTKRTDGQVALTDLSARMERYYAENHTYTTATVATGNPSTDVLSSNQSPEGNYTLSIVTQTPTTFVIRATPNGTQAAKDTLCANLSLNQLGQRFVSGTGTVADCW